MNLVRNWVFIFTFNPEELLPLNKFSMIIIFKFIIIKLLGGRLCRTGE